MLGRHGFANRLAFYIDLDGVIVKIDKQVDPRNAGSQLVANLQTLGVPANWRAT